MKTLALVLAFMAVSAAAQDGGLPDNCARALSACDWKYVATPDCWDGGVSYVRRFSHGVACVDDDGVTRYRPWPAPTECLRWVRGSCGAIVACDGGACAVISRDDQRILLRVSYACACRQPDAGICVIPAEDGGVKAAPRNSTLSVFAGPGCTPKACVELPASPAELGDSMPAVCPP